MQQSDSIVKYLPKYRQNRVSYCGAPMPTLVRASGARVDGMRFRCTDRYCEHCARAKAKRVYACMRRALADTPEITSADCRMVTLTIKKTEWGDDLDADQLSVALREAIDVIGIVQSAAHDRLRRHDYAIERYHYHNRNGKFRRAQKWARIARQQLPAVDWRLCRARPTEHEKFGLAGSTLGKTTYIWAREITTGDKNRPGWHVHAHYLVPSEGDAARLVSAWIAAAKSAGKTASVRAQRVSRVESATWRDENNETTADACSYMAKYITKTDDLAVQFGAALTAYVYGTHGMRTYDAGGAWRPLGIGKKIDRTDPIIRAEWPDFAVNPIGEMEVSTRIEAFRDLFGGSGEYWGAIRSLNQYRTNLTKSDAGEKIDLERLKMVEFLGARAILESKILQNESISHRKRQKYREFVEKTLAIG